MTKVLTIKKTVNPSNKNMMGVNTSYSRPRKYASLSERRVKYKNAQDLAAEILYEENGVYHCVVNGTFIFGDFIEAYVVENNFHVKELTISTLGYNQNNVDSLKNLVHGNFVDKLTIIASAEFYAWERFPDKLVPYTYNTIGTDKCELQVAFADTHMKIINIETHCSKHIVMHGSVNLRSSGNIEQFTIEFNKDLYDFYQEIMIDIAEKCKTIQKPLRKSKLWDIVNPIDSKAN